MSADPLSASNAWARNVAARISQRRLASLRRRLASADLVPRPVSTWPDYAGTIDRHASDAAMRTAAVSMVTAGITAGELQYVDDLQRLLVTFGRDSPDIGLVRAPPVAPPPPMGRKPREPDGSPTILKLWYTRRDPRVCPICEPLHRQPEEVWSRVEPGIGPTLPGHELTERQTTGGNHWRNPRPRLPTARRLREGDGRALAGRSLAVRPARHPVRFVRPGNDRPRTRNRRPVLPAAPRGRWFFFRRKPRRYRGAVALATLFPCGEGRKRSPKVLLRLESCNTFH